jgi:hypothetical protein
VATTCRSMKRPHAPCGSLRTARITLSHTEDFDRGVALILGMLYECFPQKTVSQVPRS